MRNGKRLGDILLDDKSVNPDQLQVAIKTQVTENKRIGNVLVEMGIISEKDLVYALSKRLNVPIFDPDETPISMDLLDLFSISFLLKNKVIPVRRNKRCIYVAMEDPLNISVIRDIEFMLGTLVQPMIANHSDINHLIEKKTELKSDLTNLIKNIDFKPTEQIEIIEEKDENDKEEIHRLEQAGNTAPIYNLVNKILSNSVKLGASDIHIEPQQNEMLIRNRVDGFLRTITSLPSHIGPPIISRLKIMSKIDIAERRRPQDGCARIKVNHDEIDLRISTAPTSWGEKMVIRILDKKLKIDSLTDLGMPRRVRERFRDALNRPQGLILTTGPTGSGKTTTLYIALNNIYADDLNIITIEDPIEYNIPGVNQIQVNKKIGITFATGLRTIVRQDPDIIMVGEIRDLETAKIAFQSSLTGHQVFSTLHCNNAVSAIMRLLNIGIEPYLLASSLTGVVAQRLVRRNCIHCMEPYTPKEEILKRLNIVTVGKSENIFYRSRGCKECNYIGYSGRIGIFEFLEMDEKIKSLVNDGSGEKEIFHNARKSGLVTMAENGLSLALNKITTPDEILRVIPFDEDDSRNEELMINAKVLFKDNYFVDLPN